MDTYLEHIIKQKYSFKSVLYTFLLYIAGTILSLVIFVLSFVHPLIMQFAFAAIVGMFIGIYFIARRFNIEYEYILTNDELDVDKIMARKTRKRMLTVSCKKFDFFGKAEGYEFEKFLKDPNIQVKFDASIGKNSIGRYYAVFENKKSQRMLLIFNPRRDMLEVFRRYNPETVIFDD